jgi:uncharacterized protein YodC (DUF2158 family)
MIKVTNDKTDIVVGDVVRVKSIKGPTMIVNDFFYEGTTTTIRTIWFIDNKIQKDIFDERILEKVTTDHQDQCNCNCCREGLICNCF